MRFLSRSLFILLVLSVCYPTYAQEQKTAPAPAAGFQQPARYYLGSLGQGGPDQLLMTVNVWGFVQKPGQYLVPGTLFPSSPTLGVLWKTRVWGGLR